MFAANGLPDIGISGLEKIIHAKSIFKYVDDGQALRYNHSAGEPDGAAG